MFVNRDTDKLYYRTGKGGKEGLFRQGRNRAKNMELSDWHSETKGVLTIFGYFCEIFRRHEKKSG